MIFLSHVLARFARVGLVLVFASACSSSSPKPELTPILSGTLLKARAEIGEGNGKLFKQSYFESQTLDVMYASNRDQESATLGKEMVYGVASVHVPKLHSVGDLETDADSKSNFDRGYQIDANLPLTLTDLKSRLAGDPDWGVLVFIHGFNVDFKQALLRSAQIAYDLKFQGKILLISWPAGGNGGFLEKNLIYKTYERNRINAAESVEKVASFMRELASLPIPIQIMVHSMGHQVVVPAMAKLAENLDHPFIQELIFNAPDLDPSDFEKASGSLRKLAHRITLYCSQNDNALLASQAINHKKRLGSCVQEEGIDVVNVSEVVEAGLTGLGHGYYSSRPVLTDIYQVILGVNARDRLFIRSSDAKASETYRLRK